MSDKNWRSWLLAAILLMVVPASVLTAGWVDLRQAESAWRAGGYQEAAGSYARAARILIWRNDLWEQAGISASYAGEPSLALEYFKRSALHTEEGWHRFGLSHYQLGDLSSALDAVSQGLANFDSLPLYNLLAQIHLEQKDWSAERLARENQARLGSVDAFAHYRLGLLRALLAPETALPALSRASDLNPEVAPAVETLRAALALASTQTDESQKLVSIGRAFGLVQEWDLALAAFTSAVEVGDENAEAWAWLGEAKQQTGQDGRVELDRAVSLDRTNPTIRGLRALYWERQAKEEQVLAEYLLAAEYDPANPAWQIGVAGAHARLGDLIAALSAYQRAVELAPTDAENWRALAAFCAENGIYVEEIGLPSAQQAVTLSPDDPYVLDTLGFVYFVSGRYASAEQTLLGVLKIDPAFFPAHLHLALTYLAQNNRTAAFNTLTYVRDADETGAYREAAERLLERYFP